MNLIPNHQRGTTPCNLRLQESIEFIKTSQWKNPRSFYKSTDLNLNKTPICLCMPNIRPINLRLAKQQPRNYVSLQEKGSWFWGTISSTYMHTKSYKGKESNKHVRLRTYYVTKQHTEHFILNIARWNFQLQKKKHINYWHFVTCCNQKFILAHATYFKYSPSFEVSNACILLLETKEQALTLPPHQH